ncbi:MAG TPA: hypothetical protein VGJ41_18800 [Nocardioides sp.]|jgi:hypothetical protein
MNTESARPTGREVRRWTGFVVLALVVYAGLLFFTGLLKWGPDPIRLALVVGLALSVIWLVLAVLRPAGPSWVVDSVAPAGPPGRDAVYATYLRLIDSHLTMATPDGVLRDRLLGLADRRLRQHHGFGLRDPRAGELLGDELAETLTGAPRRMSLTEMERHVTRIEEL